MKPESPSPSAAMAAGVAISIGAALALTTVAVAALAGSVMRFAHSTAWCGLLWLGIFAIIAAILVPPFGPYIAARRCGWRSGFAVLIVCEVSFVALAMAVQELGRGVDMRPAFVVGAGIVYAALYGALSALLVVYGSRGNTAELEGGRERSRTIYLPGAGFPRKPRIRLSTIMWFMLIANLIPVVLLAVATLSLVLTVGATVLLSIAVVASISVQCACAAWLSVSSFGGLELKGIHDLAQLAERHGYALEASRTAFMATAPLVLLTGTVVPVVAALTLLVQQEPEPPVMLILLGFASGTSLGTLLLKAEGPRRAPVEWMRQRTRAQWTAKGEHAVAKRALARASTALGLPYPPGLLVMPSASVNGWVVGKPSQAAVAVTQGLLDLFGPDELAGVFASLMARVTCRGVGTTAVPAVLDTARLAPSPLGASLRYVQACDIKGALALRDVDVLERALAATLGSDTTVPGVGPAFAAHPWLWPHVAGEVPASELHRTELLRAVDPSRSTLRPTSSVRPSLRPAPGEAPGLPAWVVCEKCSGANDVTLDRCRYCSASLG